MKKGTGVLLIVSALVLCLIIVIVKSYSSLTSLNTEVTNKESDLNVQLTRKKEQINSLLEKCKEKVDDKELLNETEKLIEEFKSIYDDDTKVKEEKNKKLTELVNKLFEKNGVELLINEEIKTTFNEIISTEKRMETAKNNYNKAIEDFNSKVKGFPSSIIASIRGFKTKNTFDMDVTIKNIIEEE